MSQHTPDPDWLDPELTQVLESDRPAPRPGFRGALARRLASDDPGYGPRPRLLWPQVLALVAVGAVLLVIGALVSVG